MTPEEFKIQVLPLKNKLYAFALSMLQNAEEAKDVVQDVMVKVWEEDKELKEYRSVEAWCMTLTRNRALDRMKRKDYRQDDVADLHDLKQEGRDPFHALSEKEMVARVKKLVGKLPALQREIILLRDFQEHTYEEICEVLNIEMNQVKVYLHRARKFIKEEITKLQVHGIQS
jgi:RNA polymerase sigma-70 factor (ECF subfamily)